ncbi:MAG: carboxypeptidase-like regulatory domain-containing protein [Candidatus Woesearchaeota archaeon]
MWVKNLFFALAIYCSSQSSQIFAQQQPVHNQLSKYVKIVDSLTNEPLPGANIFFGQQSGISTDTEGYAKISSYKDTVYSVRVSYIGYEPLEEKVRVDSDSSEIILPLKQSALESSEVLITAKKEETLDALLSGVEPISVEGRMNTQLLTGSATEQLYAHMTGSTTTPGTEFHYSSAGDEVSLKYYHIPVKSSDFFDINGVFNSENTALEAIVFAPPPDKSGMQVNIDMQMKKPREGMNVTILGNQFTGGAGVSGNFDMFPLKETSSWFAFNYEGNISGIYLKDLNPRNNKYIFVSSTQWDMSTLTVAGIHKNTGIEMIKNDKSPSLNDLQTGVSFEFKTIGQKSTFEAIYVFNNFTKKHALKEFITSRQSEIMHELRAQMILDNSLGILNAGIDVKDIGYSQELMLKSQKDLYSESLKEKIDKNNYSNIIPINIFFNQEMRFGEKTALALGAGVLFDKKNFDKDPAFGPYVKFTTEILGIKTNITARKTFDYKGLKPYSDEVDVKEYTTSQYPESIQAKLELEKGPFSIGIAYYDFYGQLEGDMNINPIQDIFKTYSREIDKDSLKAIILLSNSQIIHNPEAMQELDSLMMLFPQTKDQLYLRMNDYATRYYSNPNRQGHAVFASFRTDKTYLSATLSKTFERETTIPYYNDVALILKGHTYFDLEKIFSGGKSFTVSVYAEYSTGRPYTEMMLLPSIADEHGMTQSLEKYKQYFPAEYYELLSAKRQVPKERNKQRYPPSITSSVSLTWQIPNLPSNIEGHIRVYANNPHNLFNLIEENTYQIYHTITPQGDLALKKGKNIGFAPGIDIAFYIPIK